MARQPNASGTSPAPDGWFYARRGQEHGPAGRQGPVSFERLKKLARKGWLTADDLVWQRELPDWLVAAAVPGLFNRRRLPALLKRADDALGRLAGTRRRRLDRARKIRAAEQPVTPQPTPRPPPQPAAAPAKPRPKRPAVVPPPVPPAAPAAVARPAATPPPAATAVTVESLPVRYLLAGLAGMLAALGGIFMLVEPTLLARLLLGGGLLAAAASLLPELLAAAAAVGGLIGRLLVVAVGQWRSARQRARAQQDEALRRAAAKRQGLADDVPPADATGKLHAGTSRRYEHESLGGMVVVREPAIKLWSRPVAGVLSLCLPGLGQCYKGQILSGAVWFCCVSMGYAALVIPGLVLHLLCIAAAASGSNYSQPHTDVLRD